MLDLSQKLPNTSYSLIREHKHFYENMAECSRVLTIFKRVRTNSFVFEKERKTKKKKRARKRQ